MITARNQIRKITFLLLVLICLCSLAGTASGLWWLFDLFNHFRPQAFIITLFLFFLAMTNRDKKCIFFALAIMILNGGLMTVSLYAFPASKRYYQISQIEGNTKNISVIFSNILTSNKEYKLFTDLINHEKPDIFVTAEINKSWKNAIGETTSQYNHSFILEREDNFGLAIYSRIPFKNTVYQAGTHKIPIDLLQKSVLGDYAHVI